MAGRGTDSSSRAPRLPEPSAYVLRACSAQGILLIVIGLAQLTGVRAAVSVELENLVAG